MREYSNLKVKSKEEISMSKREKILSPKIDVIFQALFGEVQNEKITKEFLGAILDEEIVQINLSQNPILKRLNLKDKMGILDLIVEINNNEYCNVEMQVTKQDDLIDRGLFYWAKLFSRSLGKGEEYGKVKRTVSILILDFEIDWLKEEEYCTKWKLIEDMRRITTLTNKIEIIIIELPKIYKTNVKNSKLLDWLYFIDNPNSKEVEKAMANNACIREADERLKEICNEGQLYQIRKWKEDGLRLEATRKRKERELKQYEKEVKQLEKEMKQQEVEVKKQQKEIRQQEVEVKKQQKEIKQQEVEVKKQQKEIKQQEVEVKKQQEEIKQKEIEVEKEKEALKMEKINIIKGMKAQGLSAETIHSITNWDIKDIEVI